MLKINLSSLKKKIGEYVSDYYKLKEAPTLKEIPQENKWIEGMITKYVEFAIVNLELSEVAKIQVKERVPNSYENEKALTACVTKKGYDIEKRLGEHSSKFLLKNNKTAKVKPISLWEYKQKDELRSMINNEFKICKKAEALGIGPKTYDTFICHNEEETRTYKVVISEYIKGISLDDWLKGDHSTKERNRVYELVKAKIEKMHENGIIHNGLRWSSNIILKLNKDKVSDIYITDYVNAYDVKDKSMWEYNKWIKDDRELLQTIKNKVSSYSNADDVINYVLNKLLDNKNIIIS